MSDMTDEVERTNYKRLLQQQGYSKAEAERIVKANPQSTARKVSQERWERMRLKYRLQADEYRKGRKKH